MTPYQRFRQGDTVELLAVRKDKTSGELYSRLSDIQGTFPDALRFKVNGVTIFFLEDENEQLYEPKRIAHYPDDTIDIIVSGPFYTTSSPPVSLSAATLAQDKHGNLDWPSQLLSADRMDRSISSLSLKSSSRSLSPNSTSLTRVSTFSPSYSTSSSLTATCHGSYQAVSIARPMAALSSIASDITHIQHQLDRSTDQQSIHHQQLLERLVQLLQEHADAKERDERVLAELAAAKERDEEMHRMQRQTIDRLIVAQQRIEAILVQNYELHEYPIPRLFVILPDSYEKWDPRNFLAERFRLYFLCECGDHCKTGATTPTSSGQLTTTAASSTAPISVKSTIHLAKHEGYELSRPTEFFSRYGPYVLGMLRMLKHCLAVATVVSPVVALADSTVKDMMDGVKSIAESTMQAVDMSIDYLEQKLEGDTVADGVSTGDASAQEEEDMFRGLAALEGADLRRLDSFLRNKDADKILGNLYRITIDTGHVKWVCLDHYRQVYRETAMSSFLQCVETNGGVYDPQRGKVTVSLRSGTAAKDFFSKLAQHAPAVTALQVTLEWSFGTSDIAMVVDKIAQSNVRDLNFSIRPQSPLTTIGLTLRPGKGRYHSLLGLFSNTKIKGLIISNTDPIGLRTSGLPTSHSPSLLQRFHFVGLIVFSGDSKLADIISHCPHLVELKLGTLYYISYEVPKVDRAIGSLSKLAVLHRCHLYAGLYKPSATEIHTAAPYGSVALRELVDFGLPYPTGPNGLLESAIRRSSDSLEVLVLKSNAETSVTIDFTHPLGLPSTAIKDSRPPFSKLTHLVLDVNLTFPSFELMASILPSLPLVHLDLKGPISGLVAHANLYVLKSLCLEDAREDIIDSFSLAVLNWSPNCQIESLRIVSAPITSSLLDLLSASPFKRLYFKDTRGSGMTKILQSLNLSKLKVLTIDNNEYDWITEAALATRRAEFASGFQLQLPYKSEKTMRDIHMEDSRDAQGSTTRLARRCVRFLESVDFDADYYYSVLPRH